METPIDLMLIRAFQRQVADQCRVASTGFNVMNQGLTSGEQDSLWVGAQIVLTGAGNISKALWGVNGRRKEQRRPLRESLNVADDSALFDVSMRNHFEHYDERLDRWWSESARHSRLDRLLGPPEAVEGFEDIERFRVYDNTAHHLIFWGQHFDVQAIAGEVIALQPIAEREASKPHW